MLLQELHAVVEGVLGDSIATDAPLMEAGLDSIGSVEVRNAVASQFGVELPATVTFDYPSVEALAGYVVGRMAPGIAAPQVDNLLDPQSLSPAPPKLHAPGLLL